MGPASAGWIVSVSSRLVVVIVCLQLAGCQHKANYAPVMDISTAKTHYKPHVISRPVESDPVQIKPVKHRQVSMNTIAAPAKAKLTSDDAPSWVSPANGKIVALYSAKHRGIGISGQLGDPVYAISSGNIAYAGNGLRGYGNLIIIKHDHEYLSTYAYNKTIKVKAGDWVKKGQIIGQMGYKDKNKVMLYFELRRHGQPIDPLSIRGIMN